MSSALPASAAAASTAAPEIVIRPPAGWRAIDFRELWRYRELLFLFALRDIKVRYKQSLLGAAWAILPPLLNTLVFGILFALLGSKPTTAGVPYLLNTYCAMIAWQLFAATVNTSSNSLVMNANLIKKVYFPRLITPLAPILAGLVDFLVSSGAFVLMIVGFHLWDPTFAFTPSTRLFVLPVLLALTVMTTLAISLWLSSLNALYRDVRFLIPFVVQLGMFVTPVLYDMQSVVGSGKAGRFQPLLELAYDLNPMAAVAEGTRWALFGLVDFPMRSFVIAVPLTSVLLVGGLFFFRRMERMVVDVV